MAEVLARDAAVAPRTVPLATPLAPAPRQLVRTGSPDGIQTLGGAGTPPLLGTSFQGPTINDPGAGWVPPDSHGAIGPNHYLAIVNQRIAVYSRTGTFLMGMSNQSFFGVGGSVGDPRAAYDHLSGRFVITCSDFNSKVLLAVSTTNDPTGAWFKTSVVVSAGTDAGHWPDYPTLGFDANGIYTAAFMVGGANTMSIFAIEKAPLVAPVQSLGTVTAFRALPYEDAIQPCSTYGAPSGEYLVSRASGTSLRLRRINPPLTAPTLTEVGMVPVPLNNDPPNAAVQGSIALATIDARPQTTVYQAGSVWTSHTINVGGRAGVRWYQINPGTVTTQQVGTIDDPVRHYFFPSLAVNSNGDVALGMAGSHAGEFGGAWYAGRKSTDAAGQMSLPALFKAGVAAYQVLDGAGRNRWGDYSNTTLDPVDGQSFWTIQEYAHATNQWGTWIGKLTYPGGNPVISFCAGDGVDPNVTQLCPCFNFGIVGHGCATSSNANGALLSSTGTTSPDTVSLTASGLGPTALTIFIRGSTPLLAGTLFGDGVRCVDGTLQRFGTQNAVAGTSVYPLLGQRNLSTLFGTPPGSNVHLYIQAYFRDPNAVFCPPETFNVTNALDVLY